MERILVINADDLGYSTGVNRAIFRCAEQGLLRNATLMANGAAFDHGVSLIKAHTGEGLGIGVHLVLTELSPVCEPGKIADLIAEGNGLLPESPTKLLGALCRGRISQKSLFLELDRQVSKVIDCGIAPTHLDSHKHVHVLPQVLEAMVRVARKYSIPWIRQPFDRVSALDAARFLDRKKLAVFFKQHLKARMIEVLRPAFFRRIRLAALRCPDYFFGVSLTGIWSEEAMAQLFRSIPAGVSELMVHPGDCDAELGRSRTRLKKEREVERDLLLSPFLGDLVKREGIALKSYGELY